MLEFAFLKSSRKYFSACRHPQNKAEINYGQHKRSGAKCQNGAGRKAIFPEAPALADYWLWRARSKQYIPVSIRSATKHSADSMNWKHLRTLPFLDTRAAFLCRTPLNGSHLDAGCSTGGTLAHFTQLRPDLKFTGLDYEDYSTLTPNGSKFVRANLVTDMLPFPDGSFDSITLMHVLEHMPEPGKAPTEFARILKPGGRLYVEGPAPRSLFFPSSRGKFTLNFYDDPTHIAPLSKGRISRVFGNNDLRLARAGTSRSWVLIFGLPWSLIRGDWHHFLSGLCHLGGWTVYGEFIKDRPH